MDFRGKWRAKAAAKDALRSGLAIIVCIILALSAANSASAKPKFSAMAVDARTGKILFSRNADGLRHPASLTKVMTLYVLFQELKAGRVTLDTRFKTSKLAASRAPTKLGLRPGQTIRVSDAIKAIVTKSANDVATIIAENISGSESAFAVRMTNTARDLGMARTVFRNASGLPNPQQITTARDMATLSLRIQRDFPKYYPYFNTRSFAFGKQIIKTHNRLLGRYAGTDGIKTGYVAASGFNLTTSAKRGNKRIIGVVMGAKSAGSRNAYMVSMLDDAFPQCKEGVVLAAAVAGTSPKKEVQPVEPDPTVEVAAAPAKKPVPKPPIGTRPSDRVSAGGQIAELHSDSNEELAELSEDAAENISMQAPAVVTAQISGLTYQAVAAEPPAPEQAAPPAPEEQAAALLDGRKSDFAQRVTVLTKTSPDGTPLPFAIEKAGTYSAGMVIVPVAVAAAANDQSWHIQIGAYPNQQDARVALSKVRESDFGLLGDKQAFTMEIEKSGSTLYRARFSGFTEDTARSACRELTGKGFGCLALPPQS